MAAYIFNGCDMRIYDNLALHEAAKKEDDLRIYFVRDKWHLPRSPHARRFLFSVIAVNGLPCGMLDSIDHLPKSIKRVYMNSRVYDIDSSQSITASRSTDAGIAFHPYRAKVELLLFDDWNTFGGPVRDRPYMVFTPFYDRVMEMAPVRPKLGSIVKAAKKAPGELPIAPTRLRAFYIISAANKEYDHDIGSGLSPYMSFGVISMREAVDRIRNGDLYRQLMWREFYYHIAHYSDAMRMDYKTPSQAFYSATSDTALSKYGVWKRGATDYDYINRAMIGLRETGKMPNRLRMLVAELLTSKHYYKVPWWHGERYFEAWLEDYDIVLNRANWLWVADASRPWSKPEFRGFSLDRQAKNKAVIAFMS